MNPCDREERIRKLELDMAVAKSDITNVKGDVKEIKDDVKEIKTGIKEVNTKLDGKFDTQQKWLIGLLTSIVSGLIYVIYRIIVDTSTGG